MILLQTLKKHSMKINQTKQLHMFYQKNTTCLPDSISLHFVHKKYTNHSHKNFQIFLFKITANTTTNRMIKYDIRIFLFQTLADKNIHFSTFTIYLLNTSIKEIQQLLQQLLTPLKSIKSKQVSSKIPDLLRQKTVSLVNFLKTRKVLMQKK